MPSPYSMLPNWNQMSEAITSPNNYRLRHLSSELGLDAISPGAWLRLPPLPRSFSTNSPAPEVTSVPTGAIPANFTRCQSVGNRDYPAQVTSPDGFADPSSPID
ncbi:hypothetical protein NG796_16660 [Laspinema sp. A4]|uniref:hypothetical protein n=1 Tax=Laspinema sp. D2d TaxID=2953686 RepID=UPI0021BAC09C|nr:hypothetical protein [Laspinema sp. D2d]MCT7984904.1 hypothetical protein [Laspinema sp. D2d]